MKPIRDLLACASLAVAASAAADAPSLHVSPLELDAGPDTAQPSVAVEPGRGFVLTWQRRDGDRATLEFADVAPDGALRRRGMIADSATTGADGGAARWFVNWADFPSLVVLDNGDWVAHWLQKTGDGTYAYEVRVVRSTDRGRTWSRSIVPHTDGTETEHGFVSMVPAGGDRVRLVWLDGRDKAGAAAGHDPAGHHHGDGDGRMSLRSAVLDWSGTLREQALLDDSTCECCQTDMVRAGERTLAAYRDRGDGELRNIHWVVHARGRSPLVPRRPERWSADRAVHDDGWRIAGCPVNGPALAAGPAGILAVWPTMRGEALFVRAARFEGDGFGSPVDLESGAATLGRVDAAPWGGDAWLVAWFGASEAAGSTVLRLAEIDAALRVRTTHAVAMLPPGRATGVPRLAARDGVALLAWVDVDHGNPTVRAARITGRTPAEPP